jgi:tetratricopeptide (TPR) repeat protein
VIPLGRKRIFDQCPVCTKHRAMKANDYDDLKRARIVEVTEQFQADPSAQNALAAHATILQFREFDQADKFRKAAIPLFSKDVGVLAGMASHLDQVSRPDDAAKVYESVLDLKPDMPQARTSVAMRRMAQGRLDEARSLVEFLELPGAGRDFSLQPLIALAESYQKQGRHAEALALAGHSLREDPALGQQHAFRSMVGRSEKAQGTTMSILPPRKHSLWGFLTGGGDRYAGWQRGIILGGSAAALVLGGLAFSNEYIRRHRTLFVINACGAPVTVQVDDRPPESVSDIGRLTVPEGRHHVKMSGPVTDTQDIDMQAGYFQRWFSTPLWALNPGSEAVLQDETHYYAANPRPAQGRLIVGQPFVVRPHIDYPFQATPATIKVDNKNSEVVKTSMTWWHGDDTQAFEVALNENRTTALAFAESRLRRHPENNTLLKAYVNEADGSELPRVKALLKSELDRRPVVVPWHRTYQSLSELDLRNDNIAVYDGFLKSEPTSGALLYLRGRVEPDWEKQGKFYRQAMDADPRLPWPWVSLGKRALAQGNWDESLKDFLKARELKADPDDIGAELHTARIAAGQAKALVKEYQTILASRPFEVGTMVFLCESLAAAGEPDKIDPELTKWEKLVRNSLPPDLFVQLRALGLYYADKLTECEELCRRTPRLNSSALRAHALFGLKRSQDVISDKSFDSTLQDPWTDLAVSLCLSLEKEPNNAARWREQAIQRLGSSINNIREVARALGAAQPASERELSRIVVDPELKALMFAVLAERFPARRASFLASAARFNVRRAIPYQLVRRAIERPANPAS